jgi:hypothetical protein
MCTDEEYRPVSRRPSSTTRLERRSEREARRPGSSPRVQRQRPSRPTAGRRREPFNWTPILAFLGVLAITAVVVYAVVETGSDEASQPGWEKAMLDDSKSLPGVYYSPHPGPDGQIGTDDDRQHFANGTDIPICTAEQLAQNKITDPLCYQSNPPTSGPHNQSPASFSVLQNPAPKENLVHSMEHGAVIVWYNTDNQDAIKQLTDIVNGEIDRRRLVVMSRYTGMEPDTIALTAWTRLDKFPVSELKKDRIETFIEKHNKRFNPEGF